jgi:septum formation protein
LSLILASASPIRRTMLEQAGIAFDVLPAAIDEETAKLGCSSADEAATRLAKEKAIAVGRSRPGDWVIGSDSIVTVGGRMFAKPRDRDEAAAHLRFFSGKTMRLTSGVALAHGAAVDWSHCDSATLEVRELSEAFIAAYLDREWPAVGGCVGVFRIEGPGVQLFDDVEGSHFTILGMPLLPLLGALRERGLLPS